MKSIIRKILIVLGVMVSMMSCDKIMTEEEFQDYITAKEHDETIVGYWKNEVSGTVIYYNGVDYRMYYADIQDPGNVKLKASLFHWYTENGKLVTLRKATLMVGDLMHAYNYKLSEDRQRLSLYDDGDYTETYKRVIL